MKHLPIWLFCINLIYFHGQGQTEPNSENEKKNSASERILQSTVIDSTLSYVKSLRLGTDLYRLVRSQADSAFSGWEIVADFRLKKELYIAFEMGHEVRSIQREQINFTTNGNYLKVGFDYNLYENGKGMDNQVFLGLRYARSAHSQEVNKYLVYNRNHFWPDQETDRGYSTGLREGLSASWAEVVAGMKVEVINNIFMGFSIRLTRLLDDQKPENFDNLHIPGFNRKTDENTFGANFNYSLTYRIPLLRVEKEQKN